MVWNYPAAGVLDTILVGVKIAVVQPVHQFFRWNPTGTAGDRGLRFDSAPLSLHTGTGLLSTPLVELRT